MSRRALFLGTIALACGLFWTMRNSRAATATPEYQVLIKSERFEVRLYGQLVTVSAPLHGEEGEREGAFRRLFRFISGANARGEKIPMTSPVLQTTARMSFILPNESTKTRPNDPALLEEVIPAGRFASYRFRGNASPENARQALETLRAWITANGLTAAEEGRVAYYDPPWTPLFLRRNEALIRLR